jgi:hypothetical protein
VGVLIGECGGLVSDAVAAGLKEKSGRVLTDFILIPGVEPRRPAGYAWSDIGRGLEGGAGNADVLFGSRMGKLKLGLGSNSMGPAWDCWRR